MSQITSGGVQKNAAIVDGEGRLWTRTVTESEAQHTNDEHGTLFSWQSVTHDYTAGDTMILVKNIGTLPIIINTIFIYGDTATAVQIHCPDMSATDPAGTAITGINLNRTSGNLASSYAIAKGDETNNTQANIIANVYIPAGQTIQYSMPFGVILGTNDAIAVDYTTDGAAGVVTVFGYVHG